MTEKPPKPDLTEYEEEDLPLDDVLRRLVEAKQVPKVEPKKPEPDGD
jgi:hypothetical protein